MGSWRDDAACKGMDTNIFFAPLPVGRHPRNRVPTDFSVAQVTCARCPVIDDCLAYAMTDPQLVGFWGGTSVNNRRKLRVERRRRLSA